MWGQYFSEFIALAFIAMACGNLLVGVTCAIMIVQNQSREANGTGAPVGDER